jgi:hypothetical protein
MLEKLEDFLAFGVLSRDSQMFYWIAAKTAAGAQRQDDG